MHTHTRTYTHIDRPTHTHTHTPTRRMKTEDMSPLVWRPVATALALASLAVSVWRSCQDQAAELVARCGAATAPSRTAHRARVRARVRAHARAHACCCRHHYSLDRGEFSASPARAT